jgi:hypothetical protein
VPWSGSSLQERSSASDQKEKKQDSLKSEKQNESLQSDYGHYSQYLGHTTKHKYATRSVKRDLNNI